MSREGPMLWALLFRCCEGTNLSSLRTAASASAMSLGEMWCTTSCSMWVHGDTIREIMFLDNYIHAGVASKFLHIAGICPTTEWTIKGTLLGWVWVLWFCSPILLNILLHEQELLGISMCGINVTNKHCRSPGGIHLSVGRSEGHPATLGALKVTSSCDLTVVFTFSIHHFWWFFWVQSVTIHICLGVAMNTAQPSWWLAVVGYHPHWFTISYCPFVEWSLEVTLTIGSHDCFQEPGSNSFLQQPVWSCKLRNQTQWPLRLVHRPHWIASCDGNWQTAVDQLLGPAELLNLVHNQLEWTKCRPTPQKGKANGIQGKQGELYSEMMWDVTRAAHGVCATLHHVTQKSRRLNPWNIFLTNGGQA